MTEAYPLDADMLGNVIQDAVGDMNEGEPLTARQWAYIGQRALEATAYAEMLKALRLVSSCVIHDGSLRQTVNNAIALAEGRN